jgi:hypothetical protein
MQIYYLFRVVTLIDGQSRTDEDLAAVIGQRSQGGRLIRNGEQLGRLGKKRREFLGQIRLNPQDGSIGNASPEGLTGFAMPNNFFLAFDLFVRRLTRGRNRSAFGSNPSVLCWD